MKGKGIILLSFVTIVFLIAFVVDEAQAWCGGFEAPASQHYSHWSAGGETWQSRYGECWITIEDESYHHDVDTAVACGEATKFSIVLVVDIHANFDFDQSDIRPDDFADIVGQILGAAEAGARPKHISLVGHTDSYGSEAYNLGLGYRRAAEVKSLVDSMLTVGGLPTPEFTVSSDGESNPVASNTDPAGRALNRRVEGSIDLDLDYVIYQ